MSQTRCEPWGKLDRSAADPACAARLSLVAHCIDVAAVMAALLTLPTLRARLATLAGRALTARDIERLMALAFLHDIGKAGAGFQSRGMAENERRAWQRRTGAGGLQMGHVMVVAPLFCGDASFAPWQQALGIDGILDWGGDAPSLVTLVCELWLAAISHHGEPVTLKSLDGQAAQFGATWKQPVGEYDPLRGLQQLGDTARALFPDAFAAEPMLPFAPGLIHAVAGLVSLADWIGSNTEPAFYPYDLDVQTAARWPVARARATQVLRRMFIDAEAARSDLRQRSPRFEQVFGVPPRDAQLQAAVWNGDAATGRIVVLEAETGSGKTEAALWRFKTLFEAGEVDALCFLLPTRVAATGIYGRMQRFVDALFPDPALRPPTVLAVPGYLRANGEEGQALPGFKVLWPDGEGAKDRPLYWAAENSKRYFAGSAVAATIDQFLLSALQVKHSHMRGSLALRALVVVDEVHASDAYMTALLRAALQRHMRAGGHALLMSATLTGDARERLLLAGAVASRAAAPKSSTLAAPDAPYPAVCTRAEIRACAGTGRDKQVRIELHPLMRDAAAVAALAATEVARGARVLVLRNTVRQAVETQQALEELLGASHVALFEVAGISALHHGRYAFEGRQLLDARVEALFGKEAARSHAPRVLVGTQTLEISVDCDSDVMVTDLVPVDVLLQRLGRLHRHAARDAFRPVGATLPRVIVLTPPERDLSALLTPGAARGLGIGRRSAYENLLAIEATWQLLQDAGECGWQIPRDNRRLVEAGASLQALQRIADTLGGAWPEHFSAVCGKLSAQAAQALPVLVHWHKGWGEGGWSELGEEMRTRLGLDSIDIDLMQPWRTPLGAQIRRLAVPAWMLRGAAPHQLAAQTDGGQELLVTVGDTSLVYGRLGLHAA